MRLGRHAGTLGLVLMLSASSCAETDEARSSGDDQSETDERALHSGASRDGARPTFTKVTATGSGCMNSTPDHIQIIDDGAGFQVRFDTFSLRMVQDTRESKMTLNCTISAEVSAPPNMEYAVVGFDYRGSYNLEEGVEVVPSFSYDFLGSPSNGRTVQPRERLIGPSNGDFLLEDDIPIGDALFSGCGVTRPLRIHTSLSLSRKSSQQSGFARADDARGQMALVVRTAGRRCK